MARTKRQLLLSEHIDKIQAKISELLEKETLTPEEIRDLQSYCQSLEHLANSAKEINETRPY
jgi:uncharacterized protein Yka (UPF0111/DUF47 family)